MNPQEEFQSYAPPVVAAKPSFWRKLGGGSLSISILVHAALLAVGIVWVLQVIPPAKPPEVDFMPKGGGGGQPGQKADVALKKRATMTPANAPRVAAKDVVSNFVLPEPDAASSMSSVGALGGSSMSGGLGGSGSGGGRGDGKGTGFGSGMGPGLGGNATGGMNPFGMIDPNANALVGTFYDLKQTKDRKPIEITPDEVRGVLKSFTSHGWKESILAKNYQASQKLYQTKLFIPMMSANAAPEAFHCEKEVQPSRWLIVYRGNVTPPKTGRYRFVGAADDTLVVRFNNRHVLDHGWTSGTAGTGLAGRSDFLEGKREDSNFEKLLKGDYPMKLPVTFYRYTTTEPLNKAVGGFAVGVEFEAKAGTTYPIEILVSEIPGGSFGAYLMIEEAGATYEKSPSGAPILPLFRLDGGMPVVKPGAQAPPLDAAGPVWKLVPGRGRLDI